jgi:protein TonB
LGLLAGFKPESIIFTPNGVSLEEIEEAGEIIDDVPFAVIENVPIYPGCESAGNNAAKKKCMSSKIQKFVQKKK